MTPEEFMEKARALQVALDGLMAEVGGAPSPSEELQRTSRLLDDRHRDMRKLLADLEIHEQMRIRVERVVSSVRDALAAGREVNAESVCVMLDAALWRK